MSKSSIKEWLPTFSKQSKKESEVKSQTIISNKENLKQLQTVVVLETIEMEQRFPLEITENVWNQIKYLCKNIWDVEWSGILLYETIGEFGNKDFKMTTSCIIPMNKGSQVYTEFQTGTDITEFLMENTQYLMCKQGLVHSHNNMNVFFSGEDLREIRDNSVNHNYYLSLIVNNKGETCVKIASRGTLEEEKTRSFLYTSEDGKMKAGTNTTKIKKNVVFFYNVDVILPEVVIEEGFKKQVENIIKKAEKPVISTKTVYPHKQNSSQPLLFDDFMQEPNWLNYEDKGSKITKNYNSSHNKVIEGFASVIITLDLLNTDSIENSLIAVRKKFGISLNDKNEQDVEIYLGAIAENYLTFYHEYYEDGKEECFLDTLEEIVDIFEEHSYNNWVADQIYATLNEMYEELMKEKITI